VISVTDDVCNGGVVLCRLLAVLKSMKRGHCFPVLFFKRAFNITWTAVWKHTTTIDSL